jgi:hypothetical protein
MWKFIPASKLKSAKEKADPYIKYLTSERNFFVEMKRYWMYKVNLKGTFLFEKALSVKVNYCNAEICGEGSLSSVMTDHIVNV